MMRGTYPLLQTPLGQLEQSQLKRCPLLVLYTLMMRGTYPLLQTPLGQLEQSQLKRCPLLVLYTPVYPYDEGHIPFTADTIGTT